MCAARQRIPLGRAISQKMMPFMVFKRENKIKIIFNLAFHLLEMKTIGSYNVFVS